MKKILTLKFKIIIICIVVFIVIFCAAASVLVLNIPSLYEEEEKQVEISENIVYKGEFPIPVENFITVTAGFGYYDPWGTGNVTLHTGVDLVGEKDSNILAVADGEVITVLYDSFGYGNFCKIKHIADDGSIFYTLYAHMKEKPKVNENDQIVKGQIIGIQGTTGNSTGDHLHFEIIKDGNHLDPVPYLFKNEVENV